MAYFIPRIALSIQSALLGLLFLSAGTLLAVDISDAGLLKVSAGDTPWVNVGIGGGGAFFFPAGSPHDPNLVFVSLDMG